jgi:transposase
MSAKARTDISTVNPRSIGIDVHQNKLVACFVHVEEIGQGKEQQTKEFKTTTATEAGRKELIDWCAERRPDVVIMESTGIFWKALYREMEEVGLKPELINAAHHKRNCEGRKTDAGDALWLASLARLGLYQASFIPPEPFRSLRLVVMEYRKLIQERARTKNRLVKILDDSGFRFTAVFAQIDGASSMGILRAILRGEQGETLLQYVHQFCKKPKEEILQAVTGKLSEINRVLVEHHLDSLEYQTRQIQSLESLMDQALKPYEKQMKLLQSLPGIDKRGAQAILSYLTHEPQKYFRNYHALSRWLAVCPGNNESAGKIKSGKTPHGNRLIRALLLQFANAAARAKGTYFAQFYGRLRYKGHNKAMVAVAHKQIKLVYLILARGKAYRDKLYDYQAAIVRKKRPRWIRLLIQEGYLPADIVQLPNAATGVNDCIVIEPGV